MGRWQHHSGTASEDVSLKRKQVAMLSDAFPRVASASAFKIEVSTQTKPTCARLNPFA